MLLGPTVVVSCPGTCEWKEAGLETTTVAWDHIHDDGSLGTCIINMPHISTYQLVLAQYYYYELYSSQRNIQSLGDEIRLVVVYMGGHWPISKSVVDSSKKRMLWKWLQQQESHAAGLQVWITCTRPHQHHLELLVRTKKASNQIE